MLYLDGYMLLILIIALERALDHHFEMRVGDSLLDVNNSQIDIIIVFVGVNYLLIRELVQIVSWIKLGAFKSWFTDPTNYLDAAVIFMVLYNTLLMINGLEENIQTFQTISAFTKLVLWLDFMIFLTSINMPFAIFVKGVYYVIKRLNPFFFAVLIMLMAFASMFYIVYQQNDICYFYYNEEKYNLTSSNEAIPDQHCTFWESLIHVFTMMMGQTGSEYRSYDDNLSAQLLYCAYAIIVVILLSNMLIAIVTDLYEVIQKDRAAIVFWSNRLYFMADLDSFFMLCFGGRGGRAPYEMMELPRISFSNCFEEGWKRLVSLFDFDLYSAGPVSIHFWSYLVFLAFTVIFIIPVWLLAGLCTAGWLWPPQVREYLLVPNDTATFQAKSDYPEQTLVKYKAFRDKLCHELNEGHDLQIFYKPDTMTIPPTPMVRGWSRKFYMCDLVVGGGQHKVPNEEARCVNKMIELMGSRTFPASTRAAAAATEQFWRAICDWLENFPQDVITATNSSNHYCNTTPLHLACYQQDLPKDVLDLLLKVAGESPLRWRDENGMLPIHLACAYGATKPVIQTLAESFSEGKTRTDKQGRTPLHLAVDVESEKTYSIPSDEAIALVCTPEAAKLPDAMGKLPLHHACAAVAEDTTVKLLLDANPDAMYALDNQCRSPLHILLSNAGHPNALADLVQLLSRDQDLVNKLATGIGRLHQHPIDVLGRLAPSQTQSETHPVAIYEEDGTKKAIFMCLKHLVEHSRPTTEFYVAVQGLPVWLRDQCVCLERMQILMNQKITLRIPTAMLLLDFSVQFMIICSISLNAVYSIHLRHDESVEDWRISGQRLLPLLIGGCFYVLRGAIHMQTAGLQSWMKDPSAWTNLVLAFIVLFITFEMMLGSNMDEETFVVCACLACGFVLMKFFGNLGHFSRELAVFAGGLPVIAGQLVPFFCVMALVLSAFSTAFYTLAQGSLSCVVGHSEISQFCDRWSAFLQTFAILLEGGLPEGVEEHLGIPGYILSIIYAILVYFVMGNLLIAVVVISYKSLKERSTSIFFWTNRLHFLSSFGFIGFGVSKEGFESISQQSQGRDSTKSFHKVETFGQASWAYLMDLFREKKGAADRMIGRFLVAAIAIPLCRFLVATIVIPTWIIIGLLTFGCLWPPQIRRALLKRPVLKSHQ